MSDISQSNCRCRSAEVPAEIHPLRFLPFGQKRFEKLDGAEWIEDIKHKYDKAIILLNFKQFLM